MDSPDLTQPSPENTTPGSLMPAVSGKRYVFSSNAGQLSYYVAQPEQATNPVPMLLIHSVNAAGSSYEVKPLYEHYRKTRTVFALDLPGFGFSERSKRDYTPALMTDAVLATVEQIQRIHGPQAVDALAISLSSEFLARAATVNAQAFRTVGLVSPTGFDRSAPRLGAEGSTMAMPWLHRFFTFKLWSHVLYFKLLCSRPSMRFFLSKTWGSKNINEGLLDYDYLTAHQPGAEHAPYCFVSGYLFSKDSTRCYEALQQPVWMCHGVRGDFVDYSYKKHFESRPNWSFNVFETGALPHFEVPEHFIAAYDRFLEQIDIAQATEATGKKKGWRNFWKR